MVVSILIWLSSCVHVSITCHQHTSLVPLMFIYYYRQQVSIALQRAQSIMIFQHAITFSHNSSPLPHIPVNAPPSLVYLQQRMFFQHYVFHLLLLLQLSWFSFHVFTLTYTSCLVFFVDEFPSLFLYIQGFITILGSYIVNTTKLKGGNFFLL